MAASACQPLQEGNKELKLYDGCDDDPSAYGGPVLLPRQATSSVPPEMSSSSGSGSGRSTTEARALKIHSEAERRRRQRINAHLATLRRMIPDTKQMDKATLLAAVVDRVKSLKRKSNEVTGSTPLPLPETDEVCIECYAGDSGDVPGTDDKVLYIKASVSCDDRTDLVAGIVRAFRGLRLRALRADMTSLGGRVRHVFTLCKEDGGTGASASLKEAVRQALARAASPETVYGSSHFHQSNKRQRILQ